MTRTELITMLGVHIFVELAVLVAAVIRFVAGDVQVALLWLILGALTDISFQLQRIRRKF